MKFVVHTVIQKLKSLFLFFLWSETKLSIENGSCTLVGVYLLGFLS